MNHGSLFSGIGGFDLAAEWMGWNNIFHCEWNPFGQKVLNYYWPNAISYGDITQTDFTIHRGNIDILTGGFPCQPYSQAGKRLGKEDERHLWPEMLRAIREIQPTWIVGENVSGIINWNDGLVFDEVQAEMEAEGYETIPFLLPACSVNAPHRRERVWFVAYSGNKRCNNRSDNREERHIQTDCRIATENKPERNGRECGIGSLSEAVTDTCNKRLQGDERYSENERQDCNRRKSASRAISELYRGSNFEQFPTQSPICSGNDGFSNRLDGITFPKWRNESIKAFGNAIVPQVVYQIFKSIEHFKQNTYDN